MSEKIAIMGAGSLGTTRVDFLIFLFGALGVLGSGITILGWVPAAFNLFNGWALFLDGVVGFYAVISTVSASLGVNLPMGKPFYSPKNSK